MKMPTKNWRDQQKFLVLELEENFKSKNLPYLKLAVEKTKLQIFANLIKENKKPNHKK